MVYSTDMIKARTAKFQIGQIVRHRVFSFRGVIFDIDPESVSYTHLRAHET